MLTKSEICQICADYGAKSPEWVFWIVRIAFREGEPDIETIFEQLKRNQPQLFHSTRPRPFAAGHSPQGMKNELLRKNYRGPAIDRHFAGREPSGFAALRHVEQARRS